jgi:prophage regulatory protein
MNANENESRQATIQETEERQSLLVSADRLAGLLQVSTRTLWRLLSAGKLPKPIRLGGSVRWRLDEIGKWIDNGCPVPDRREQ